MTSPAIRPCTRRWWGVAVWASVLVAANGARAEEPTIDEVRYHPTEVPPDGTRTRVLLTGAALTAGWYGVGLGTSYLFPNAPNARDLRLPVVGPWLALGDVRCGPKERDCREAVLILRTLLTVLSGVGQAGGLFAITEGLFLDTGASPASTGSAGRGSSAAAPPRPGLLEGRPARSRPPELPASGRATWAAVPVVLPDGAAIEFVGRF